MDQTSCASARPSFRRDEKGMRAEWPFDLESGLVTADIAGRVARERNGWATLASMHNINGNHKLKKLLIML